MQKCIITMFSLLFAFWVSSSVAAIQFEKKITASYRQFNSEEEVGTIVLAAACDRIFKDVGKYITNSNAAPEILFTPAMELSLIHI